MLYDKTDKGREAVAAGPAAGLGLQDANVRAPAPIAAPPPAPAPAAGARRSLAASKMYMLDMLQLQRTPEAAELRATIQCTSEPAALVDALLAALRTIVAGSTQSYGERVAGRLAEILPVEAPRLEAQAPARNGAPPALSIVA